MRWNFSSIVHRIYIRSQKLNEKYHLTSIGKGFIGVLVVIFCILTYLAFKNSGPLGTRSETVFLLLNVDVAILLILSVIITQKVVSYRRGIKGKAGARLHGRIIRWFGSLLIVPSIITMFFSVGFINLVIESWFNDKVQSALYNSREVAEAYLAEHKKLISENASSMANEIQAQAVLLFSKEEEFSDYLSKQVDVRGINAAIAFTKNRDIIGRSELAFNLMYQPVTNEQLIRSHTAPVLLENLEQKDHVRALVRIDPKLDAYLLISKFVDAKVLQHLEKTDLIVQDYNSLHDLRASFKIQFILIFVVVAFLLMLLVIFLGTAFGNRLARPISTLIAASERIKEGDLSVRVDVYNQRDELGTLSLTFNQMAEQLEEQKRDLLQANKKINRRRHFIESVLRGVTAGIIRLDAEKRVTLINASAMNLLKVDVEKSIGKPLMDLIPEMSVVFYDAAFLKNPKEIKIDYLGYTRILMVQMTQVLAEENEIEGYVITFDDVSDLIQAQRKAAWSDVARRIAHEIKNPLTPILLSTDRLHDKFLPQIQEGKENFEKYIDTISRQVRHVRDLINEFSEFARMPAPKFIEHDLSEVCNHVIQLYKTAYPRIIFEIENVGKDSTILIDPAQIERALSNLVKNAAEVLQQNNINNAKVRVSIQQNQGDRIDIVVEDNGPGFPVKDFKKLLDPYVSYKEMGTGLGLAIVKRTMEDHGGNIILGTSSLGGASVCLRFIKKSDKIHQ